MNNKKFLILLISLIIGFAITIFFISKSLALNNTLLQITNLIIASITAISYLLMAKQANRPQQLVNSVLGGTLFRLFATIVLFLVVILMYKNSISKTNYLLMAFIYMVYTAADSIYLSKASKQQAK